MSLADAATDANAHRRGVPPVRRPRRLRRARVGAASTTSAARTPTPTPSPLDQAEVVVGIPDNPDPEDEWQRNLDAIGEQYGLAVRLQQIPINPSTLDAEPPRSGTPMSTCSTAPRARRVGRVPPVARPSDRSSTRRNSSTTTAPTSSRCRGSATTARGPATPDRSTACPSTLDSKALVWTKEPEFTDSRVRGADRLGLLHGPRRRDRGRRADTVLPGPRVGRRLGWLAGDGLGGDGRAAHRRAGVLRRVDRATTCRSTTPSSSRPSAPSARWCTGQGSSTPAPRQAAVRDFGDALFDFTRQPEACLMTPFPSFMPAQIGAGRRRLRRQLRRSRPSGPATTTPSVGGGGFAVAVTDRPEVRAFMAALASPDWGVGSAQLDWPGMLPANARFDVASMANPVMGEIVAGIQAAIRSDDFRFDASDAMPAEVGTRVQRRHGPAVPRGLAREPRRALARHRRTTSRPPGPSSEAPAD